MLSPYLLRAGSVLSDSQKSVDEFLNTTIEKGDAELLAPHLRVINKEELKLPRDKFKLVPDADSRNVDCFAFDHDSLGHPMCTALKNPYCLADDAKPCSFQAPRLKEKKEARSWVSQND